MAFHTKYPFQRLEEGSPQGLKPTPSIPENVESGNTYLKNLVQELDKYIKKVMEKTFQVYVLSLVDEGKSGSIDHSDRDRLTNIAITSTKAVVHHSSLLVNLVDQFLVRPTKDKEFNRLVDLRAKLMTIHSHFDRVLMHFTVMPTMMLPPIGEIRGSVNVVKDILKGMKVEDIQGLFPPELRAEITPDHELFSILGLTETVLEQMMTWNSDINERIHRGDEYILRQIVQDIYDDIVQDDGVDNKVQTLLDMVFTSSRVEIFKDLTQQCNIMDQQPIVYWVHRYLGAMFRYNNLLSVGTKAACDQQWVFSTEQRMCPALEDSQELEIPHVQVQSRDSVREFASQLHSEAHVVLFHGTDELSARSIVGNGIMLGKGSQNQDFSDGFGFYLSTEIEPALDWALSGNFAPRVAVVAFSIPKDVWETFTELDLTTDNVIWRDVVNYNRTGRDRRLYKPRVDTRRRYREADYVIGSNCNLSDNDPWPREIIHEGRHRQMCILSETMAERIGDIRYLSVCSFDKTL